MTVDATGPAPPPPADAPDPGDAVLLARIAARDRTAFAAFFTRHAGRVKGYLVRSGFRGPEADEAVQEVMLSVWRRAGSFDPARAGALTWLFAIARNRRIDMLRRRRPEPDPDDPLFQPEPDPGAAARAMAEGRDAAVRAALAALGPEQRDVVRLAFYEGLSHAQIASLTDLPLGTVKSRLRLAMERLRGALGADFSAELHDD